MMSEGLIVNAGYSRLEKRNMGYVVNPKRAFEKVSIGLIKVHPAILFSMKAPPASYLVNRYANIMGITPNTAATADPTKEYPAVMPKSIPANLKKE